ncbi:NAD(P)H-dependent oxidoreductase [Sporomusa malonica]|uniref:NADPH-dependent FMN reductase n=1 Tax=Sporomusa malonica TaxID=112901 RepID=A0A1W2CXG1_9FIRM|nr:NAD(P)H-dependent oxidoreductase [Sporomusa malonica]SMC89911.1 NADPH-dependent FMN reductase [Sporomusa malonica]
MKIVVLNGSPKGEISVTMQYVGFIQKKFPQHELKIINIAQRAKQIENKEETFQEIIEEIKEADGILWAFPLYVFLVHSQYKRFIELITERSAAAAFKGKPAAILTTSIHFYDHTAHNYMQGICDDLDMKFYASYSAEMRDLFKENERERLLHFFQGYFEAIVRKAPAINVYSPLYLQPSEYTPKTSPNPIDTCGRKIVIITDAEQDHSNLKQMVDRVAEHFTGQAEVINLHDIDIKGGCLGCIRCGYDNTCAYSGKDGFIEFYTNKLKTADILVFAGKIRDRYLSSLWKTFFDRGFFNTHIPSLAGKQVAFLISGPLGQLSSLRQILEAYTEWQQANLVGIVTDEEPDSQKIDNCLRELAIRSVEYANSHYIRPTTFLGVGGRKIFRDEIWGHLRFPFAADHHFYKTKGLYDFPHKDYSTRVLNLILGWLIKIPAVRKKIYGTMMISKMVEPFQKLLSKL